MLICFHRLIIKGPGAVYMKAHGLIAPSFITSYITVKTLQFSMSQLGKLVALVPSIGSINKDPNRSSSLRSNQKHWDEQSKSSFFLSQWKQQQNKQTSLEFYTYMKVCLIFAEKICTFTACTVFKCFSLHYAFLNRHADITAVLFICSSIIWRGTTRLCL